MAETGIYRGHLCSVELGEPPSSLDSSSSMQMAEDLVSKEAVLKIGLRQHDTTVKGSFRKELTEDLLIALKDALMWIDAIPTGYPAARHAGVRDGDEVDALIDESMRLLDKPVIAIYRCDQCAHLYHAEVPIVTALRMR